MPTLKELESAIEDLRGRRSLLADINYLSKRNFTYAIDALQEKIDRKEYDPPTGVGRRNTSDAKDAIDMKPREADKSNYNNPWGSFFSSDGVEAIGGK